MDNVKRLLGKTAEARSPLEEARRRQQLGLTADLTDFTLCKLAKPLGATNPVAARALLAEAKGFQSRSRNRLGLLCTLLLDARLAARADLLPPPVV